MRAAGVDTVFFVAQFILDTQFAQAADAQGWKPHYLVSDDQGMTECEPCVKNMPASFNGTIGITVYHYLRGAREGMPEPAADRACRETYNRASGENWKWGTPTRSSTRACRRSCSSGRWRPPVSTPTRGSWTAAVRTLGNFAIPTVFGGGFNGKTDFADILVTIRWFTSCNCYHTVDQPRTAGY